MIYFSEIKNKIVFTEDRIKVGNLDDLVFLSSSKPQITKLVILNEEKEKEIVPIKYLIKINDFLTIKKNFEKAQLEENELFIMRNLLDKQIIDLKGSKIVRVNDVIISSNLPFTVIGVDVGISGILRWLGINKVAYKIPFINKLNLPHKFLSWADIQPLELSRGEVRLKKREEKLNSILPEDLADYLEKTNILDASKMLEMMPNKQALEVFNNLNLNYQVGLFKHYSKEKASKIISLIEPDEAVDILLTISKKRREEILSLLPEDKKKEIEHLIKLSKTEIGKLITTEYLTFYPNEMIKDVLKKIKKETNDFATLYAIYVINNQNQLVGVLSLHELLLQDDSLPIYKAMIQNVIVIHLTTPLEIALKKMLKYRLSALPVVNQKKEILGIITFDDLADKILKNYLKL